MSSKEVRATGAGKRPFKVVDKGSGKTVSTHRSYDGAVKRCRTKK